MALSSQLVLLPLLFFLSANQVLPQTSNGRVSLGASLFATENSSSWLSQNGEFAFGFRKLRNQDDIFFLLCIWYVKIPDKTIIWCANGDKPAEARSNVVLTPEIGLALTTPLGEELWKSESVDESVANGVMSDEGNFVLEGSNSNKLWESYKNPTDTILPSQVLDMGQVLSSHQSETNYSKGRFQFRLREDGNVVLNTVNLPSNYANEPYYATNISGESSNSVTATTHIVFNESGYLYVSRGNGERFNLTHGRVVSTRDYYVRATISFDGIFTQYFHPRNFSSNVSWTPLWSIPDNICISTVVWAGIGVCGYNTICSLKEDKGPKCECIEGYSLINPDDSYGSCKPDFIQGCKEDEITSSGKDAYDIVELRNAGWPGSDYIRIASSTKETCTKSCLNDCLCAVAVLRGGTCWKKRFPLSNGRVDNSRPSIALIKIRKGNSTILSNHPVTKVIKKNQSGLIRVTLGILSASVCVNFIRRMKGLILHKKFLNQDGFKDELGRGAFGIVYKGFLIQTNASTAVAVKKLSTVLRDGEREFKAELKSIGQTHHKNLVHLLGYCDDGQNRLLVYEFLCNGTLANFLFGDIKPSWNQRCELALGIAKGLLYLHEECYSQIIHCDIKPQNILLDEYNNAKISDFGLAKLLMMNQSRTHTSIRGTKGYVAPEWFRNMAITSKVDVYSFGVVLLEIVCCRRNVDMETGVEGGEILTDWAYDCFREGPLDVLVDYEVDALSDKKRFEIYVMVSLWCVQENPSLRPNMRRVVQMLEGVVEVSAPPCPSPF
ncbi:G-type lectin S-receptor-like serine/threonine-protein kinase RLK1 [Humulus lupulus]|uniref:G-type lectin S-receptor-like serine/threonine-protein kinase RLK1 n=1 Tax=Humulus lupulus TaxID=3486 RepID=UPI002B413885|nr:G-type lectin S-receptor-like serine/threonine-protein kinase RLK1 [Humulus lupulus]